MPPKKQEIKIRRFKLAPPPRELPVFGRVRPEETSFFGRTNYEAPLEEKKYIFGIKREDRRRHLYLIGKSGVGKSKLLELLIRQDIAYGHGICLIDPHGDLIEDILKFIPKERINDVVMIDPSDSEYPISFNPLQKINPDLKHRVTQGLIEVMQKQFGANWTPRLEHVFRFTTLALLDYPKATMAGMISMLTDREYRQGVVEYIQDDMVKRFWAVEFADWSEKFDTDAIIPLVNKLGQFLSDPLLRSIFGQEENKIDMEYIMNNRKILLINLAKGKLGEENSSFFGSMFMTKIYQAGLGRAAIPEEERENFYLYVDEFQNLMTTTFENLFAESRKYGLNINVAHQYMAQLLPSVLATVLGNIGTIITFRVGGEDARKLAFELAPIFRPEDMINLGVRDFFIKMTIEGETYDPFSAKVLQVLPPAHRSYRDEIISQSRKKHAISLEEFKQEMKRREEFRKTEATQELKQAEEKPKKEEKQASEPLV